MSKSPTTTEAGEPRLRLPPIHSGEILAGELVEAGSSSEAVAEALGVPSERISEILIGKRSITADMALRLSRYFGTSAEFWLKLQMSYDLAVAERDHGMEISKPVRSRAA